MPYIPIFKPHQDVYLNLPSSHVWSKKPIRSTTPYLCFVLFQQLFNILGLWNLNSQDLIAPITFYKARQGRSENPNEFRTTILMTPFFWLRSMGTKQVAWDEGITEFSETQALIETKPLETNFRLRNIFCRLLSWSQYEITYTVCVKQLHVTFPPAL